MSDYFVLHRDIALVGKYAFFDDEPDAYEADEWESGVLIPDSPTMRLKSDSRYVSKLSDILLTRIELLVFSEAARQALQEAGVTNIEYHPVEVEKHDSGDIVDTYRAANFIGRIACLDESTGEISRSSRSGNILDLEEFSLDDSRIKPASGMPSEVLLFRLDEFPSLVLVHQRVRDAFVNAGLSGAKFDRPEDYIGT